ncbi:MAG: carboxypeptidase-like regulatory domain-containing protein [Actinomycetota bacterium]
MRKLAAVVALVVGLSAMPSALAEVPSNDNLGQAEVVTTPFADITNTGEATTEVGEPITNCDMRPTQATIWYSFTAATDTKLFVNTNGSDFDTIVAVYEKQYVPSIYNVTGFEGMYLHSCEDPGIEDEFTVRAYEGDTYYFQVGGHLDQPSGTVAFNVDLPGSIGGTITDESAAPISGICVEADSYGSYGGWYSGFGYARTDASGSYQIDGLAAGDYVVSFYGCNSGRQFYFEYYDNQQERDLANKVAVSLGQTTSGINATLTEYIPPPPTPPVLTDLALTDLKVSNVPLETDDVKPGLHSGWVRQIDTEVSNLSAQAGWGFLTVKACSSASECSTIYRKWIAPGANSKIVESFRWNALGWVGDVAIRAEVRLVACNGYDPDSSNDRRSVEHYVMLGGIGTGTSLIEPYDDDYYGYHGGYGCVIAKTASGSSPPPAA